MRLPKYTRKINNIGIKIKIKVGYGSEINVGHVRNVRRVRCPRLSARAARVVLCRALR